ncbi:RNase H domain-containing protein [Trichonephila clavipes]|nr:RNase H domain-containing protein [Trichonephila clavipes]
MRGRAGHLRRCKRSISCLRLHGRQRESDTLMRVNINVVLFSYTRAFGDGPRNFEPWKQLAVNTCTSVNRVTQYGATSTYMKPLFFQASTINSFICQSFENSITSVGFKNLLPESQSNLLEALATPSYGLIASNFSSELLAIEEALILYSTHLELSGTTEGLAIFSDSRAALEAIIKGDTNITSAINVLLESLHCRGKSCLLQWIPAHVNIEGSECADSLAKEGRNDDQLCPTITLADANAVANYRLLPHRYKKPLIVDFDCSRNLTSIIARLRTGHFKGMKISSDKTRTYIPCKNCNRGPTNARPHPRMSGPYSAYYTVRNGATGFGATRGSLQR